MKENLYFESIFVGDELWLVSGYFPTDYAVITIEVTNQKNLASLDIAYSEEKYSTMDKPETPCIEDVSEVFGTGHKLFLECSRKALANSIRKLPCIPGGIDEEIFHEKIDVKFCNNTETARALDEQIRNEKLLRSTNCIPPCQRTKFTFKATYGHANALSRYRNNTKEKFSVFFYQESSEISEEKIETFVYDFFGLVSAVGGNMGLFLGFSCLSIGMFLSKKIENCGAKICKNCGQFSPEK